MTSSVLRYSQRLELIHAARRFGVDRFEANLLIAAVLERGRVRHEDTPPPTAPRWLSSVILFLTLQSGLALGAWWMIFR